MPKLVEKLKNTTKRKFNSLVQINITNFEINLRNYNNFLMVFQIRFIFCKCPNTFGGRLIRILYT